MLVRQHVDRTGRTNLHLDIQNACPSLLRNVPDRFYTGPIIVSPKLRMLNEAVIRHKRQESLPSRKMILDAVVFSCTGGPCRIFAILISRVSPTEILGGFREEKEG